MFVCQWSILFYIFQCVILKDKLNTWQKYSVESSNKRHLYCYLAPGGGCKVLFSPCMSVCLCLCVCLCVCPANILVFYFSAIWRDIDLKFIQDTYRVVLNTQKNIDLHRSKVKVTGTVHCFLKVQSYHKNWAIEFFFFFSYTPLRMLYSLK